MLTVSEAERASNCNSPIKQIPCSLLFNAGPLGFINEIWQDWPHWTNQVLLLQCEWEHPTSNLCCLLSQHLPSRWKEETGLNGSAGLRVQLGWWSDVNPHTLEVGEGYHWLFIYSPVAASLNYRMPYLERKKDWERKKGKGEGNCFFVFFCHCQNHLLYLPQQQQNHIFIVLSKSRSSFTLLPITRNFYLIKQSPTYISLEELHFQKKMRH